MADTNSKMSTFGCLWRIGAVTALIVGAGVAFLYWVIRSTQIEPEFYAAALSIDAASAADDGDEFEREMLDMHNQVRESKTWSATFTESQINGWMASDLPEKFPDSLPNHVVQPRVAISPGELKLAFRVETGPYKGVITAIGHVFLTQKQNQIAVRIKSVRSGVVPIAIEAFANQLSNNLSKRDIAVTWSEQDGDPVANILIPANIQSNSRQRSMFIDSIEQLDGKIRIAGRTELGN